MFVRPTTKKILIKSFRNKESHVIVTLIIVFFSHTTKTPQFFPKINQYRPFHHDRVKNGFSWFLLPPADICFQCPRTDNDNVITLSVTRRIELLQIYLRLLFGNSYLRIHYWNQYIKYSYYTLKYVLGLLWRVFGRGINKRSAIIGGSLEVAGHMTSFLQLYDVLKIKYVWADFFNLSFEILFISMMS